MAVLKKQLKMDKSEIKSRQVLQELNSIINEDWKSFDVKENGKTVNLKVRKLALGPLTTIYGKFLMIYFEINDRWKDYFCIVKSTEVSKASSLKQSKIVLRIDSGCETGQRFFDLTCDCKSQLEKSFKILKDQEGVIISIPSQDGRGKGIAWKLNTLFLQEKLDIDTVSASEMMHDIQSTHPSVKNDLVIDERTYSGVIALLKYLGLNEKNEIILATNNPIKKNALLENGFQVARLPIVANPTKNTKKHLLAKQKKLGHDLNIKDDEN